MFLGRIEGKVWATLKDEKLSGIRLCILQPIDEYGDSQGFPTVVVDTIGAKEGDTVFWVNSTEAGYVLEHSLIPSEASVVGLVDELDLAGSPGQPDRI